MIDRSIMSADPNSPNFQSCLGRQSKFLTVIFSNKYPENNVYFRVQAAENDMIEQMEQEEMELKVGRPKVTFKFCMGVQK